VIKGKRRKDQRERNMNALKRLGKAILCGVIIGLVIFVPYYIGSFGLSKQSSLSIIWAVGFLLIMGAVGILIALIALIYWIMTGGNIFEVK
jgi:hypothetical protein